MVAPEQLVRGLEVLGQKVTVVEGFSALTEPLRVVVVAVVPLAALVVAPGRQAVVKLSTAP